MEPDVGGSNPPSCTKLMNKKTFKPSSELPAGFIDRQEEELLARDLLISNIKKIMAKYGFQYLETPSFEFTDSIGKFLPDKDRPSEGVFSFEDDKKWLSLRYDLTAPLARYAAKNFNNLPRPFKRYQLGTVWRNEKPGPGRFREFLQFDADYIGTSNLFADAELCCLISEILSSCGLTKKEFIIKISNRKLTKGLLEKLKIIDENKQTIIPTTTNPFMNINLITSDKTQEKAPPSWNNEELQKKIEDKFGYNLYRDVGDLYGKSNSQREFYTMPSTTIPNNQTSFAKWLYNTGPTCKEKSIYCTPEMDAVPYVDNTNPYSFTDRML